MQTNKLTLMLTKAKNSLEKTIDSINFIDNEADAIVEGLAAVMVSLSSIESVLAGESQTTPFIYTTSIVSDLNPAVPPEAGKVVDAISVWNIERRLTDLINALDLFDGDQNPNDYLENLNQLMGWVQGNTDFLNNMATATITSSGFMSPTMVTKLNSVETGATKNTISQTKEDTSADTVPSSKVASGILTIASANNLDEVTLEEIKDPEVSTGHKKFKLDDILNVIKYQANKTLLNSRFTRTIYIPGYLTIQEFPVKLVVPEGTWLGTIDTNVSNNNNDAIIRLMHTDGTIIDVIRSVGSTVTPVPSMKAGSWSINVIDSGTVTAIDMTLYVDLVKDIV